MTQKTDPSTGQDGERNRSDKAVLPIIAALAAAIAPHIAGLPLWINLWCLLMWGYMLVRLKTGWPLPTPLARYGLTFAGIAGLLMTYYRTIGGDAFVGLMALMAALKPFEMPTQRHRMITILLTYFMTITSLFRSDALITVVYMFFSVFVTTTAMVMVNAPGKSAARSRKLAGTILVQALPLMVLLFLAFPRLQGSVFGFHDPGRGKTGFSDMVAPGNISAMALDHAPAFRVSFNGPKPAPGQLYWRGAVFEQFDGAAWRPAPHSKRSTPDKDRPPGQSFEQTIVLQAHDSQWLVALDRPITGPSWAVLGDGQTLKAPRKIKKITSYTVVSLTPGTAQEDPPEKMDPQRLTARILAGAAGKNMRTRQLARQLVQGAHTPTDKAARLLDYFTNNSFAYTLNAPLSRGPHPIDRFMFDTRKGYCEHYASALAFMLNAAGVPARVVGGYLGGELNPFGDYLIVRQSYAHAWVEFFDGQKGWTRTDPTQAVSPQRISVNPDGSASGGSGRSSALSLTARFRFAMDAVNLKWESWFTGYSSLEQRAWLGALGLKHQAAAPALMGLSLLCLAVFLTFCTRKFLTPRPPSDPVRLAMEKFYKKMAQAGMTLQPGQGPVDFARECLQKRPGLSADVTCVMDLYLALRYKPDPKEATVEQLAARISRLNPGKHQKKESL